MPRPKKPRPRKNGATDHVDWDAMDAINGKRSETTIMRSVHALSHVLDEIPELKVPAILGALNYAERRLLLQTLLQTLPREEIALNIGAIKIAAMGNPVGGYRPRQKEPVNQFSVGVGI